MDWFNPPTRPNQHSQIVNATSADVKSIKIFRGAVGIESDANATTIQSDLETNLGGTWDIVDEPDDPLRQ